MDEFSGFPELPKALEIIASLNPEQFKILHQEVTGPDGYDHSLERCEALAKRLTLNARDVFCLLSSLQFLYFRTREWASDRQNVTAALREFFVIAGLQEKLGKDSQLGYQRLDELLSRNPVLERRRKLRWLQTGILETATSFASFVDIRPNFTDDRSTIEDFVPVVIFRVDTDEDKPHVFQLTTKGVVKLRTAIDDVEKKLAKVRADKSIIERLHDKSVDDEEDD